MQVSISCSGLIYDYLQGGKEYLRNYQQPNPRSYTHSKGYHFTSGHTGLASFSLMYPLPEKRSL